MLASLLGNIDKFLGILKNIQVSNAAGKIQNVYFLAPNCKSN
jgi:hypothetical protein